MPVRLMLPDGSAREYPEGTTPLEVAQGIGPRLAKAAVGAKLDGEAVDLTRPLTRDAAIEIITDTTEDGRHIMRHSAAHVLAQAVLDLYPGASFAIGPPIEDGFYYDFDIGRAFSAEDLETIEDRMAEIIEEDQPFAREVHSKDEALEMFSDQPFKLEIIEAVEEDEGAGGSEVTVYRNLDFIDLCRGPHLPSTGKLRAVKLLRSAGAYWRGDENRPQLQRIYGTAWEDKKALQDYVTRMEESVRRDHRRLGRELDLYSFPSELGSGLAVWHPKGGMLRKLVEDYSRQIHQRFGFDFVNSPHLAKANLWNTSGHLDYYAENMYPGMELDSDDEYRVKPMNCPFHVLVYRSSARSYRDLPMRLSELGAVYRYERSGVVHGLLRARGFTQDDSHTFCTREQLPGELQLHLDFVLTLLRDFGFDEFQADLSTRNPEKAMGELPLWKEATEALRVSLERAGVVYRVAEGEAAFYGPKIDIHVKDAIGRPWQMSTIQMDFFLPERFELEYTTTGNDKARPVMIHSAKFGSLERFVGVLIEHYAGALPGWLAPVQATVVPVADRHIEYASEVAADMRRRDLRPEVDTSSETVGEKIRRAIAAKVPVVLVVGDDDVAARTVGIRLLDEDHERRGLALDEAIDQLATGFRPPL